MLSDRILNSNLLGKTMIEIKGINKTHIKEYGVIYAKAFSLRTDI